MAVGIMILLMCFVVPKFKDVFAGMNMKLPGFTELVLGISEMIKDHILETAGIVAVVVVVFLVVTGKTKVGRMLWDKFKLKMPALGPVISKVAISRFTRTLGTLVSSGVPILQALTIVEETPAMSSSPTPLARFTKASRKARPSPRRSKRPAFPADGRQHGGCRRTNRCHARNASENR